MGLYTHLIHCDLKCCIIEKKLKTKVTESNPPYSLSCMKYKKGLVIKINFMSRHERGVPSFLISFVVAMS
jgi:hypothetical protein